MQPNIIRSRYNLALTKIATRIFAEASDREVGSIDRLFAKLEHDDNRQYACYSCYKPVKDKEISLILSSEIKIKLHRQCIRKILGKFYLLCNEQFTCAVYN
ncbi:hypothetical protein HZB88_00825 [archaeon]|nr:hypothetical protein [archaeon]